MIKVLFSLIIRTLNRPDCIKYCLESLRNQIYKDFEVFNVDQSDNASTEKVLRDYSDLAIVCERVPFKGLSRARNAAIHHAKGDYLCLIDDDAYYDKEYLSKMAKHIRDANKKIFTSFMKKVLKRNMKCLLCQEEE